MDRNLALLFKSIEFKTFFIKFWFQPRNGKFVSCEEVFTFVGEDEIAICSGLLDPSQPNWREALRSELLDDEVEVLSTPDNASTAEDDEFDKEVEQPTVKSPEAMKLVEQLQHFAQFHGYQELSLSLVKLNDQIYVLKLRGPKRQTRM